MANSKIISADSFNSIYEGVNVNSNNLMPIEIGVKGCKEKKAAYHLVPFLAKIIGIEESNLTKAISKSIIDLDNLAKNIDGDIDSDSSYIPKELTYNKFKNLEMRIVDCFSYLTGSPELENLITETLKCVNISFKYNTVERTLIYNLKNSQYNGCTTFYLFPLVKYLFSQSKLQIKSEHLFFLVANYIQILDDFIDVIEDKKSNIKTPITNRLDEINSLKKYTEEGECSFQLLTIEVFEILLRYFNDIQLESKQINKNLPHEVFKEWEIFHNDFRAIKFPSEKNEYDFKIYQNKILERIPQIICYGG